MSGIMPIQHLPANRSVSVAARVASTVIIVWLVATGSLGCVERSYHSFVASHDAIRPGMTIGEAFDVGLVDYMVGMGVKNVPGATRPETGPASDACKRHVLDILYTAVFPDPAVFRIRVYCNINAPSALQVIPENSFKTKQEFLQALDSMYASWAKHMEFRVESPPLESFGTYKHYIFTTDQQGRIASVSPILSAYPKKQQ